MKSQLAEKDDTIMIKQKNVLMMKILKEEVNEVTKPKDVLQINYGKDLEEIPKNLIGHILKNCQ